MLRGIYVLSFLLLAGCLSNHVSTSRIAYDYDPSDADLDAVLNLKAILITRFSCSAKNCDGTESSYGKFSMIDPDRQAKMSFLDKKINEIEVKVVEPGAYKDPTVRTYNNNVKFNGMNLNVNKSDVVYIGDLVFDGSNCNLKVEDHFNQIRQILAKKYPELLSKLKKNTSWVKDSYIAETEKLKKAWESKANSKEKRETLKGIEKGLQSCRKQP